MSATETKTTKENNYEGMFLVDSARFATDPEKVTADIMSVLKRAGATVIAHRPWQDGKLAYEIEGLKKGLHYIVCFRMPGAGMTTLVRQCQLSETIVRQMVIRHGQEIFDATVASISGVAAEPEAEAPAAADVDIDTDDE